MTIQVLITGKLHDEAISLFAGNDLFNVTYQPDLSRNQLLKILAPVQVLVSRSETTVDEAVFDAAPALKVVVRAAVGVGNIALKAATERGVLVLNTPGRNTNSAAELTFGLLLALNRHLTEANDKLKSGGWDRHRFTGEELRFKHLGIVGLGNVGHRVARFAKGFEMKVSAYDPYIAPQVFQRHEVAPVESLEELASQVDILSVHVPLNDETTDLVNQAILGNLPGNAIVLNAARGGIINEDDLLKALITKQIAGAGIDTWVGEPEPRADLAQHPNVVGTPHIGASTVQAQLAIGRTAYEQTVKAVTGGIVDHPVNLPEIGIIDGPLVKHYAVLGEKLGSLAANLLTFAPEEVRLIYRGELSGGDHSIIRLGFMKGYAAQVVDGYVSYVNASDNFLRLGIKVTESDDASFNSYKSALKIIVRNSAGEELSIGGVVFDDQYLRISLINGYVFEAEPDGQWLVLENNDQPGVIGSVGQFLATRKVNINSFGLSRNKKGGRAMAIISIDSALSSQDLTEMQKLTNVLIVHQVKF